jgi:hypothetical protein
MVVWVFLAVAKTDFTFTEDPQPSITLGDSVEYTMLFLYLLLKIYQGVLEPFFGLCHFDE